MNHHVGCHQFWVTASRLWRHAGGYQGAASRFFRNWRWCHRRHERRNARHLTGHRRPASGDGRLTQGKRFLPVVCAPVRSWRYHTAVADSTRRRHRHDQPCLMARRRHRLTSISATHPHPQEFIAVQRWLRAPSAWRTAICTRAIARRWYGRFGVRTRTALSRLWVAVEARLSSRRFSTTCGRQPVNRRVDDPRHGTNQASI